jgi:hypothetical protein
VHASEDTVKAAKMATEAAAEDAAHMSRSTSLREHKSSLRSSSESRRCDSIDKGKLRSKSMARSHSRSKELRSGSEDGRKSFQDKLKEMKNLEGSKHELRSESRRGDSIDKGKLRSKSMARSHSRSKELRSGSEDGRKSFQDKLKEMKNLEGSKHELRSESRRSDTNVTVARALFDRIDLDGSGTLDRSEIAMLATKMVRSCRVLSGMFVVDPCRFVCCYNLLLSLKRRLL